MYKTKESPSRQNSAQSVTSSASIYNLEKRLQTLIQNFFTSLLVQKEITFSESEDLVEMWSFNFYFDKQFQQVIAENEPIEIEVKTSKQPSTHKAQSDNMTRADAVS